MAGWLARSHTSGWLLDLGYGTSEAGTAVGPRRYCVNEVASRTHRLDLRLPAEPRSVRTMRKDR